MVLTGLGKPESVQRKKKEQTSGGGLKGRAELLSFGSSKLLGQPSPSQTLEGCSVNFCLPICQVFFPWMYITHYFKTRTAFSNYSFFFFFFLLVFVLMSINQNMYISRSVCKFVLAVKDLHFPLAICHIFTKFCYSAVKQKRNHGIWVCK